MKRVIKISVPIVVATDIGNPDPINMVARSRSHSFEFETMDNENSTVIIPRGFGQIGTTVRYLRSERRCFALHNRDGVRSVGRASSMLAHNILDFEKCCRIRAHALWKKLRNSDVPPQYGQVSLSTHRPSPLRPGEASSEEVASQLDFVAKRLRQYRLCGNDIYRPIKTPFLAIASTRFPHIIATDEVHDQVIATYSLSDLPLAVADLKRLDRDMSPIWVQVTNGELGDEDAAVRQAWGLVRGFCVAYHHQINSWGDRDYANFLFSLCDDDMAWLGRIAQIAAPESLHGSGQGLLAIAQTLRDLDIPAPLADLVREVPWFNTLRKSIGNRLAT